MSRARRSRNSEIVGLELSKVQTTAKGETESQLTEASQNNSLSGYLKRNWWAIAILLFLSLGAFGAVLKYMDEDAQRQKLLPAKERSSLYKLNDIITTIGIPRV